MIRPVGRGTLLGMLRPKLGLPYERGAEDLLGTVLRAVIAGRLKLPAGGRGTDRDMGEVEGVTPPDLVVAPVEGRDNGLAPPCGGRGMLWFVAIRVGSERAGAEVRPREDPRPDIAAALELPRLCGGRGIKRPADAGEEIPPVGRPSIGRLMADVPVLRAGGVIRLTVGREAADRDGRAAGAPALDPSLLSRVGDTSGLPMVDRFRKAPGEIRAAFWATGSPRWRVFRETAVNAPGLLA
jgi:hypothetical protein